MTNPNPSSSYIKIDLSYLPAISFAMQQNYVSTLRKFVVQNTATQAFHNIRYEISTHPTFSETLSGQIDFLAPQSALEVALPQLKLDATFFSELSEKLLADFTVKLFDGDQEMLSLSYPIDLLAFDQWSGLSILPQMIAAFVTPNQPRVASIIRRAAEFLGDWTGSPSLDEYQSKSPDRVQKQLAALYQAIAEYQFVYASVPASFESKGQRVRLCETMFATQLGNCLEMSLLYAACAEAMGLYPLLIFVEGHAFVGAWLIEETFVDSVGDDPAVLSKRMADGINELILMESTAMNAGQHIKFDEAVSLASKHLANIDKFHLYVDIKRCRLAGIRPLPLRIASGGWDLNAPIEPQNSASGSAPKDIQAIEFLNAAPSIPTKQKLWERKLLDLSLRNNLLNLRITKSSLQIISVDLNKLEDALADGQEFQIYPRPDDWQHPLLDKGAFFTINANDPINNLVKQELGLKRIRTYLNASELTDAVTTLYRSSRTSLEENGANTLYLALGLLKWFESDSSKQARLAPILLLPVEIVRKSAQKGYVIRTREEDAQINITLLEMLRHDFGVNIGFDELPRNEHGIDVALVFNVFRKAIMGENRWDVQEQAVLGIFSFSKFIMWNDIHNNAAALSANKIVKSLMEGQMTWTSDNDGLSFDHLDSYRPADLALPISADSFQLEAICSSISSSTSNNSFILHGPPGTGKSQTITNIIANALFQGKKVLFVAEKMAALSVVEKRLNAIGLGPFTLELHSNKSTKSAVIAQLKTATEVVSRQAPAEFTTEAQRLHVLRDEINNYVKDLHQKHSQGLSIYEAIARYESLEVRNSSFEIKEKQVAEQPATALDQWLNTLPQLQIAAQACGQVATHPFAGTRIAQYTPQLKNTLSELLDAYGQHLPKTTALLKPCIELIDASATCKSRARLIQIRHLAASLAQAPPFPVNLLTADNLTDQLAQLNALIVLGAERDALRTELQQWFRDDIFQIDATALLQNWQTLSAKWFLPQYLGQSKILKQINRFAQGNKLPKDQVETVLDRLILAQQRSRDIEQNNVFLSQLLGSMYLHTPIDWVAIAKASEFVAALNGQLIDFNQDILKNKQLRQQLADQFSSGVTTFKQVYAERLQAYVTHFDQTLAFEAQLSDLLTVAFDQLPQADNAVVGMQTLAFNWKQNLDELRNWCTFNYVGQQLADLGWCSLVDAVRTGMIDQNEITVCFQKALYKTIAEHLLGQNSQLLAFSGPLFEGQIRQFKALNSQFEKLTQLEVVARLSANIPSFTREASSNSEVGILQKNIRSNGRGTSIRKLFDSIPSLLSRLSPCMLMSPISVAQYLDVNNTQFDLVIFDEASQMPTYEAVGAIARAKNLIVVGDPKQMPPTSFFATQQIDEDNLELEDLESILDDCLALSMPSKHLLWHYRSKHESLIRFSNSTYYENKLLTFPSPDDLQSKVTFVGVEGKYERGGNRQNRAEAEAVVAQILSYLNHAKTKQVPARSIGVVTFSSTQQTLIEDLLNSAFVKHPDLESLAQESSEPIFIKNLENVQGDERDIILFSVGYGPDQKGNLSLNFGPLNRVGGWRRLNVAVSRARYVMKVFSSFTYDRIDLSRTSSEGILGLRSFLEYAQKGKSAIATRQADTSVAQINQIGIEELIAAELRLHGYALETHIGTSAYRIDVGVVNPKQASSYLLGILCDGRNYQAARTAKDRDIIQTDVLHALGWNIERVWSLDWFENKSKVVEKLLERLRQIELGEVSVVEEEAFSLPTIEFTPLAKLSAVSYALLYTEAELSGECQSEDFLAYRNEALVTEHIQTCIELESPISRDRLFKKILQHWGLSRSGSRVDAHFSKLLASVDLQTTQTGDQVFLWSTTQDPSTHLSYRTSNRNAFDIPAEEVCVAVREVLENEISLAVDDLIKVTSRLLGYNQLGNNIKVSMQNGIDLAIAKGWVIEEGGRVRIG